jgi:hypothetical protein
MQATNIVAIPTVPGRPEPGALFRHVDGGYYMYLMTARHSEDQSPLVVYQHLWPFEREGDPWARPQAEWDKRFTPVSAADLQAAMRQDQGAAQAAVHEAKAARRAAGG